MRRTGSRKFTAISLGVAVLIVGLLAVRTDVFKTRITDTGTRTGSVVPEGAPPASPSAARPAETPEEIVKRWPERSRRTAAMLLEKYGAPHQFDRDTMVWFNTGDWKKTVLRGAAAERNRDFLEQSVGYLVPSDKIGDLKRFNPKLDVSLTAGELTFASDSEATNRLALNLAEEIVTGKRDVADAKAFYRRTARLAASGKSSTYLDRIQFDVDNARYMTPTGADR